LDGKIRAKIPIIISTEISTRKLMPLKEFQHEDPDNFRSLPGLRLRTVPVVGTQPALFGVRIASYIICKLTKYQAEEFV